MPLLPACSKDYNEVCVGVCITHMPLLCASTCTCVYVNKCLHKINKKQVRQHTDDDVARTREHNKGDSADGELSDE